MLDKDAEPEIRLGSAKEAAMPLEAILSADDAPVPARTIRYLDDATFSACLEEVVTTHSRLLSKLAE